MPRPSSASVPEEGRAPSSSERVTGCGEQEQPDEGGVRRVVALVDQAGEQPPGGDGLLAVQRRGGERTEQRLDDVDGVPGLPEVLAQEVGGPVRPAVEVAHRGQGPVRPRTSAGTRSAVARVRAVAVHACGPSCTNSVPS